MNRRVSVLLLLLLAVAAYAAAAPGSVEPITKNGAVLYVERNADTGSGHRVYGLQARVQDYGFAPAALDRAAIAELSRSLLADYADALGIDPRQVALVRAESDGVMWFVGLVQSVAGVPVYGTEIGFSIDAHGQIVTLGADAYPRVEIAGAAIVERDEAVRLAREAFGVTGAQLAAPPRLVLYPQGESADRYFVHAWQVHLAATSPLVNQVLFVDAETGRILDRLDNVRESSVYGTVSGDYWPQHYYDATVHANFTTTNIKLFNVAGQLVSSANTDGNGYYYMSGFAYGVYIIYFPLADSYIEARGGDGSPISSSFTVVPGTVNKNWGASNGTNVRWHADSMHDYYKNTFGYSAMDYQMRGYVDQGSGTNGAADGNHIYFGSQSGQYWARSSDVVFHEYTHNTIYHLYGRFIGSNYYDQGSAMDEGLSDYFACTRNNDPIQGESVGVNRNLDNNTYTWNANAGAHWNGQVIGGASWDVRQAVGQSTADGLVFRALQISPHAWDFDDFLYNMLVADNTYYGGTHGSQIRTAFAGHGITLPVLTVSVSGPTHLSPYQQGTWTASVSGGSPPYSYQWWYRYPGIQCLEEICEPGPETLPASTDGRYRKPPKGVWLTVGTNSPQLTRSDNEDFELKCVVTDGLGTQVTSNIRYVSVYYVSVY